MSKLGRAELDAVVAEGCVDGDDDRVLAEAREGGDLGPGAGGQG